MNDKTKHGRACHYTGRTSNHEDFVYCPVVNIVSWSLSDFLNRWGRYCKMYLDDVRNIESNPKVQS